MHAAGSPIEAVLAANRAVLPQKGRALPARVALAPTCPYFTDLRRLPSVEVLPAEHVPLARARSGHARAGRAAPCNRLPPIDRDSPWARSSSPRTCGSSAMGAAPTIRERWRGSSPARAISSSWPSRRSTATTPHPAPVRQSLPEPPRVSARPQAPALEPRSSSPWNPPTCAISAARMLHGRRRDRSRARRHGARRLCAPAAELGPYLFEIEFHTGEPYCQAARPHDRGGRGPGHRHHGEHQLQHPVRRRARRAPGALRALAPRRSIDGARQEPTSSTACAGISSWCYATAGSCATPSDGWAAPPRA